VSSLRIVPIVEGHGEVQALPILLRRVWTELLGGVFTDVLAPIRSHRDQLTQAENAALHKAVSLAAEKLRSADRVPMPGLILILIDAEDDLACSLGPELLNRARGYRSDTDVTCVIANHCYETWFAASADSLRNHLDLTNDLQLPVDPEQENLRKSWISRRIRRAKYSETVDQARLTAAMDLALCRANSRSFDKLCRELEGRLHRIPSG